jgi:hypothetical protein
LKKGILIVGIIALIILLAIVGAFWNYFVSPSLRGLANEIDYRIQKMDDKTKYETRKQVEDTCRAMIASYKTDKLTYEQYIESEEKEERNWANQAKMRANKTVNSYNEYILKNTYIWKDNVPSDIDSYLNVIE